MATTDKEERKSVVENRCRDKRSPDKLLFHRHKRLKQTQNQNRFMRPMTMTTDIRELVLTKEEKKSKLSKVLNESDKLLQIVLWEIDCSYTLLEHQFRGVRALAGVPNDFPSNSIKLKPHESEEDAIFDWVVRMLENVELDEKRGVLMADVMGLGKTVQAVAACILRNAIALAQAKPKNPTLIVSPNDAVLSQWYETLVKAGVNPSRICRFKAKNPKQHLKGQVYVLLNRYDLQTECRHVFSLIKDGSGRGKPKTQLFPFASKKLLTILKNQYDAEKGKAKNNYNGKNDNKMSTNETIVTYLEASMSKVERSFRTCVIDEAHFLKSITTFWGICACLVGLHCERMIPMSGTPYCNTLQDLASLMAMIDPSLDSANSDWWRKATEAGAVKRVKESTKEWYDNFVIRRDKEAIAKNLPAKLITKKPVGAYPLELFVYESYEDKFLSLLQKFQKLESVQWSPLQRRRLMEYHKLLMSLASCMRSALIHPVLPCGGRDLTILFSPTRRNVKRLLTAQERPSQCVCCKRKMQSKTKRKYHSHGSAAAELFDDENLQDDGDDINLFIVDDDVEENGDDSDDDSNGNGECPERKRGTGNIKALPPLLCQLAEKGIRHFACESCVLELEETGEGCPLCTSLLKRLRLDSFYDELLKRDSESVKREEERPVDMRVPRPIHCSEILGGFRSSAKLDSIVYDFGELRSNEKVLIVSFFKGSLDLVEAILDEHDVEIARFDGDIPADEREQELNRFKTKASCRVLLMTVQTGGTGLNLVCANHVWFVDRFWNPMVMEQCEDRCYRLGQQKDVDIAYHDVSRTIDDVMRLINEQKSENATVLLADGSKLSTSTSGMSFKDVSGCLGGAIRAMRFARVEHVKVSKDNIAKPLPPLGNAFSLDSLPDRLTDDDSSLVGAIASMLKSDPDEPVGSLGTASLRRACVPSHQSSDKKLRPKQCNHPVPDGEVSSGAESVVTACNHEAKDAVLSDDSSDESILDAISFRRPS